jgi:peptide/nickel transport system permease protein
MSAQAGTTVALPDIRSVTTGSRLIAVIKHYPLGALGAAIVSTFVFLAVFSPLITPYDATRSVALPLLAPDGKHWFGTDSLGQDVFSRVLQGSQISLAVALAVMAINVSLATLLGLIAGYFQGPVDYLIQRCAEVWTAFPVLIGLLLIVAVLGPPQTSNSGNLFETAWQMRNLILAFSIAALFVGSRVIRAVTLTLKNQAFVEAARAVGARDSRIIIRHILPNVMPFVIVQATSVFGTVILAEAALSFLGLGAAPGTPSWGQDLAGRNRTYIMEAPWVALAPGMAISLTVLGFNLLGDALRDALDPRLRGSQ